MNAQTEDKRNKSAVARLLGVLRVLRPLDALILCACIFFGILFIRRGLTVQGDRIIVEADGTSYEYSLQKDGTYHVQGALGDTIFEVKNGAVHIIDSPCQNKLCVHQGWSSPLVCLPNKVIITIENYGDFDAVSE